VSKQRYWKLTPDEMENLSYDEGKLLNWEIKGIREPEENAVFIGVFLYRRGTPLNYKSVKGITYYHNNLPLTELPNITKFLKNKFAGKETEKGDRIFLEGSKEIYSAKDIALLAKELESNFNTKSVISLEFENLTEEEGKEAGLPDSKLLPIPGK
jgi:hypothetical protein